MVPIQSFETKNILEHELQLLPNQRMNFQHDLKVKSAHGAENDHNEEERKDYIACSTNHFTHKYGAHGGSVC